MYAAMWSRRFLLAGISSSVIAAAIALFGVLLLFYWLFLLYWIWNESLNAPPNFTYNLISPFSVSFLVYPACWYFLIFRRRNYSIAQTSILVSCIYPIIGLIGVRLSFVMDLISRLLFRPSNQYLHLDDCGICSVSGPLRFGCCPDRISPTVPVASAFSPSRSLKRFDLCPLEVSNICAAKSDVRSTPKSGHLPRANECPLRPRADMAASFDYFVGASK